MVLVLLLVILVVSAAAARVCTSSAARPGPVRRRPRLERQGPPRLPRPAADRPPAGLLPLVDSPRVVARECERGLRELEQWLAEQAA